MEAVLDLTIQILEFPLSGILESGIWMVSVFEKHCSENFQLEIVHLNDNFNYILIIFKLCQFRLCI